MSEEHAEVAIETLVKVALALLAILLALYIIQITLGLFVWLIQLLIPLLILTGVVLLVLWWFGKV